MAESIRDSIGGSEIAPDLLDEIVEARLAQLTEQERMQHIDERTRLVAELDQALQDGVVDYDEATEVMENYDAMGERPDVPTGVHEEWRRMQHIPGQQQFDI